jgi:hypothetical protein
VLICKVFWRTGTRSGVVRTYSSAAPRGDPSTRKEDCAPAAPRMVWGPQVSPRPPWVLFGLLKSPATVTGPNAFSWLIAAASLHPGPVGGLTLGAGLVAVAVLGRHCQDLHCQDRDLRAAGPVS